MSTVSEKLFTTIQKSNFLVNIMISLPVGKTRTADIINKISPYLKKSEKIIDIGCGGGDIAKNLQDMGHKIVPVDVHNLSFRKEVTPVIYDGKTLPFKDNSFDVALLITVLHHVKNPQNLVAEARRVAKRLIIIEDIYDTEFNKYLTYTMDSVVNLEFFGHPHSNKTDKQWQKTFKNLKLKILEAKKYRFWKFFNFGVYHLTK